MAEYFKGTLLASPVVRGSSGDTYGTHHSVLGVGGYMEVKTVVDRDRIPVDTINGLNFDGISSGQRRLGMLVHVLETNEIYHLHPKVSGEYITLTQWNALSSDAVRVSLLSGNTAWYPLFTTGSGSTASNGERISKSFSQFPNSFTVGDVLGYDGSDFLKVDSSSALTIEPLGVVTQSGTTFTITYAGYINTTGILDYSGGTLVPGSLYYLASSGYTGKLTKYAPTGLNELIKPMLVATSGNTGVVLQYRGTSKSEIGVSLSDFYNYTANTQTFLDTVVTGATNIGYFTGYTGIQTLSILSSQPQYSGQYTSLYNYYYRDDTGVVRIGTPTHGGVLRRGYISSFTPRKSWLYNNYTGASNQIGWILVDGDISVNVGTFMTAYQYGGTPYTETQWWYTGGTLNDGYYNNGGNLSIDVNGNLFTGSTYNVGGPIYSDKKFSELRMRTLISKNDSRLKITYDDNFIYFSGGTESGVTTASNVGTGVGVFDSRTGDTLQFKTLLGSGNTVVYNSGQTLVIYSSGGSGGGTYNLSSPAVLTVGGISSGTVLTGKTAFELFEELLVPELFGTITAPSTSIGLTASGLYEIGCSLSQIVTGTFSRGSISPQYCSVSPYRSGCANAYCFTGSGMPSGFQSCVLSPASQTTTGYTVVIGTQSWGVCTRYDAGSPALGSKGTQYCAALTSGCTSAVSNSIVGVYPIYGTTSTIATLTKQTLQNMTTGNNIQVNLVAESGGNKQKFEIPCAWLGAPTSRPLVGVCQFNTVSSQWEYPGGSAASSLLLWTCSASSETVQGNSIGYCQFTYNGVDRSAVCIRLVF